MSHSHFTASEPQSSKFQQILDDAVKAYEERTKKDLLLHPLASQLQNSNSPEDILSVLYHQVQGPDQSRRLKRWLDPTVNILYTLSHTLGTGVPLVCPSICASFICAFSYYLAVILTRESNLHRNRYSPFSAYRRILNKQGWTVVKHEFVRQLKETKTILWVSSSALKCFSVASRYTQRYNRPRK
jgi:hypothetical protein